MDEERDYYIDHEYDENYFTFDVEKQYIKETGKMPYLKKDKNLPKHFREWLKKRAIDLAKTDMEAGIKEVLEEEEKLNHK